MVTHDLDSLYTVCDRIAALADGKVVCEGSDAYVARIGTSKWCAQLIFNGKRSRSVEPARRKGPEGNGYRAKLRSYRLVHVARRGGGLPVRSTGSPSVTRGPRTRRGRGWCCRDSVAGLSRGFRGHVQRLAGWRSLGFTPGSGGPQPGHCDDPDRFHDAGACRYASAARAIRA